MEITELRIINNLGIGGCIDAVTQGDRLYVIGNGNAGIADHRFQGIYVGNPVYL